MGSASLAVDKLTLTFHVPEGGWPPFTRRMNRRGIVRPGGPTYRASVEIPDPYHTGATILVQFLPYARQQVPFGRIEWNPTKAPGCLEILAKDILPFLPRRWRSTHVTRVDVAVDYPCNLREHQYYAGNRKGTLHYAPGNIETIYLGSPKSNARLRIYDKRKELELQGEPVPDHPLTRIEAQRRSTQLCAAKLDLLPNPFRGLHMVKPIPDGLHTTYRLALMLADHIGLDTVLKQLSPYCRRQLKELTKKMAPEIPHPREVFEADWDRVCRERLGILVDEVPSSLRAS